MKMNFGYNISADKSIDYDKTDKSLAKYLTIKEPSFDTCIACGSCSATCSASNFAPLSLRKVNIQITRGDLSSVKTEIERCMYCGKCTLVCPRGVNTRNVILQIKKYLDK